VLADEKIRVSKSNRMALKNMKRGGESYNDVVRRLINLWILVPLVLEEDTARELQLKAAEGVSV